MVCRDCNEKHLSVMCFKQFPLETIPAVVVEDLANTTCNVVYLQKLTVKVIGKNKSRNIRVIIDTGSQHYNNETCCC